MKPYKIEIKCYEPTGSMIDELELAIKEENTLFDFRNSLSTYGKVQMVTTNWEPMPLKTFTEYPFMAIPYFESGYTIIEWLNKGVIADLNVLKKLFSDFDEVPYKKGNKYYIDMPISMKEENGKYVVYWYYMNHKCASVINNNYGAAHINLMNKLTTKNY